MPQKQKVARTRRVDRIMNTTHARPQGRKGPVRKIYPHDNAQVATSA